MHKIITDEIVEQVKTLWKEGASRPEIIDRMPMLSGSLDVLLTKLFKSGELERRRKYHRTFTKTVEPKEEVKVEEGYIKCTPSVSTQCIWGYSTAVRSCGLCDYILRAGHSRGCPPDKCTKFEQITKGLSLIHI